MLRLIIGNKNYSTWSMRPWVFLKAFEVEFEEHLELLTPADTVRERLLRHSPSARVPVLQDGELRVWDSLAICEYVSERYLNGGGYPADAVARAEARVLTAEMHAGFAHLRDALPMNIRAKRRVELDKKVRADIARIDEIWSHYPARYQSKSQNNEDGWLCGRFSIADCFYAPVAMRFATYADIALSNAATHYWQRLCAHPAVQAWRQGGLAEDGIVPVDEAGEDIS